MKKLGFLHIALISTGFWLYSSEEIPIVSFQGATSSSDNSEEIPIVSFQEATSSSDNKVSLYGAIKNNNQTLLKHLLGGNTITKMDQNGLRRCTEYAARQGNIEALRVLLSRKEFRDALIHYNNEALHKAAYHGHMEVIELLIDCGVNCNAVDLFNLKAIDYAHYNKHANLEKLLLRSGSELTQLRQQPLTLVSRIERNSSLDLFETLFSVVQDPEDNSDDLSDIDPQIELKYEASIGNRDKVIQLIGAGVSVDGQALTHAAGNGHKEIVELLLKAGASDPDHAAYNWAIRGGYEGCAQLIVQHRKKTEFSEEDRALFSAADKYDMLEIAKYYENASSISKSIVLCEAAQKGTTHLVGYLLDHGADCEVCYYFGNETPLVIAARAGQTDVVRLLLNHDAQAKHEALHAAVEVGAYECTALLVQAGAIQGPKPSFGETSFLVKSCYTGNEQIIELLLKSGAHDMKEAFSEAARTGKVNLLPKFIQHCDKKSVVQEFFYAVQNGRTEVVSYLLDTGVSIDAKNNFETALDVAAHCNQRSCVELLLKRGSKSIQSALNLAICAAKEDHPGVFTNTKTRETERSDRLVIVQALLDAGADPKSMVREKRRSSSRCRSSRSSKEHYTPLICKAAQGHSGLLKLLLKAGADVSARFTSDDSTALHAAVSANCVADIDTLAKIEVLLAAGVEVNAKNSSGRTALYSLLNIFYRGNKKIRNHAKASHILSNGMQLLLDKGAQLTMSMVNDCVKAFDSDFMKRLLHHSATRAPRINTKITPHRNSSLGEFICNAIRRNDAVLFKTVLKSWYQLIDRSMYLSQARKRLSEVFFWFALLKKHYPICNEALCAFVRSKILLHHEGMRNDLITVYLTYLQDGTLYNVFELNNTKDDVVVFLMNSVKEELTNRLYRASIDWRVDEYYGGACKTPDAIKNNYRVFYERYLEHHCSDAMKEILDPELFDETVSSIISNGIAERRKLSSIK